MASFKRISSLPLGVYDLLYADPPWRYEPWSRETGLGKSPDRHYPTMPLDEMMALPFRPLCRKSALLVMWVYDSLVPESLQLAAAWGFKRYVTVEFRWFKVTRNGKPVFSTGRHTRAGAEMIFLFSRGNGLPVHDHGIRKDFKSPVREHSRKPDEIPGWLERLYQPKRPLELFSRTNRRGWDSWGNEVGKFGARS